MDIVLKRYGNYGEGDGSQVVPCCRRLLHLARISK